MTRHLRGNAIWTNALEVRLADADEAVLTAVEHDVLRVEVLERALSKALAAIEATAEPGANDGIGALRAELAQLDGDVGRLARRSQPAAS
jgi:hypothetical protein